MAALDLAARQRRWPERAVKPMLRLAGWATLTFVLAWTIAHPYQRIITSLAVRMATPPGDSIDVLDLEIFFPFDMSVFVALCLASSWATWRNRLRASGTGLAILLAVQLLTLAGVIRVMLGAQGQPADQAAATERFVVGVIRLAGLVAAGGTWAVLLGGQKLPQWMDSFAARSGTAHGGKR